MAIYGYGRVSTDEQLHDLQVNALLRAGVEHSRLYLDKMSGVSRVRPALDRVLGLLREGDEFIVWKLDRLGRTSGFLINLVDDLTRRGVRFRSLTEAMDMGTPMGRGMFGICAVFAQIERDMIAERTREGLRAARERGVVLGRKGISGEVMDRIIELGGVDGGRRTVRAIAEDVGVSSSVVHRVLEPYREVLKRRRRYG
ncbi:MAG TPA: recombinase family protein [Alphaproteobacteria bacterium]|nr:recombinase family protein [Alphaproteobacteria bacterium]